MRREIVILNGVAVSVLVVKVQPDKKQADTQVETLPIVSSQSLSFSLWRFSLAVSQP